MRIAHVALIEHSSILEQDMENWGVVYNRALDKMATVKTGKKAFLDKIKMVPLVKIVDSDLPQVGSNFKEIGLRRNLKFR